MATRYTSTVPARSGDVARLAAVGLATGIFAGVATHLIGRVVDLMVLGLALAGLLIGFMITKAVRRFQLSRPGIVSSIAALAVLIALATQLGADFAAHRARHVAQSEETRDSLSMLGLATDEELEAEHLERVALYTFADFLAVRYGLETGAHPTRGELANSLGPIGALTFQAVELALALALAIILGRGSATEPVCPRCGVWRVEEPLGATTERTFDQLLSEMLAGNPESAAALLQPPDTREQVRLTRLVCPDDHDGAAGVLRLTEERLDRRRRVVVRKIADLEASAEELDTLRAALQAGEA